MDSDLPHQCDCHFPGGWKVTRIALEGNPILGFPLQQLIAQEKAPDPAGPSANAEDSGLGAQRLYPDVSCCPSMTQQSSGLTALKLRAGQTSYETSRPLGSSFTLSPVGEREMSGNGALAELA